MTYLPDIHSPADWDQFLETVDGSQVMMSYPEPTCRADEQYGSHTWPTHRNTFDKLVFDDLRNNVVLTASLAYLAASADEPVSRERREIVTDFQGRPTGWPECQPAVRRSSDSPRMQ